MTVRLYFDEVGNGDLKASANDDNVRYLSLTGVITLRNLHDKKIQPALDGLKAKFFGPTPERPVILHRRELINRLGPFSVLNDDQIRSEFDKELPGLIDSLPYKVITVTIDKRQHLNQYAVWNFDPYHYCMTCMVERFVRLLDEAGLTGDVVGEARTKKVDKKLKASFLRLYEEGTSAMSAANIRKRLTSKNIKLEPKSSNIAGLQLADLIAHPSYRAMKLARENKAAPDDFGSKVAEILNAKKYRRRKDGQIHGYGLKWLP
jgi:Protein of unknown function (DUF3800)